MSGIWTPVPLEQISNVPVFDTANVRFDPYDSAVLTQMPTLKTFVEDQRYSIRESLKRITDHYGPLPIKLRTQRGKASNGFRKTVFSWLPNLADPQQQLFLDFLEGHTISDDAADYFVDYYSDNRVE